MLFLFRLLTFPVTGPVNGMKFILEQIREQALAEILSEEEIQSLLIEASMQHQAGEISDAEYHEIEVNLFEQLKTLRQLDEPVYEADYFEVEYSEEYPEEDE